MQVDSEVIVRKQVQAVDFGFYDDNDVRDRSVVEIVSSQVLDPNNNPLAGGLCDPLMGPAGDRDPPCRTCGLRFQYCPGHFGHIELAVPVHHPLMVKDILSILRAKCSACHKLRAPPRLVKEYRARFNLLYKGELDRFHSLEQDMDVVVRKHFEKEGVTEFGVKKSAVEVGRVLDEFLETIQPEEPDQTQSNSRNHRKGERRLNSYEHTIRADLIKTFTSACRGAKHCAHCGAFSPAVREDSSNKFFRATLPEKYRRQNSHGGVQIGSALQEGDEVDEHHMEVDREEKEDEFKDSDVENDSDEEGNSGSAKSAKKDHFMHAKEVQAQLRRSWEKDPYLMNCLFGAGDSFSVDGYRVYFLQAVPVPPNRFRPSMETAGMVVQHAQSEYLSKIIELNETLRELFADGKEPLAYTAWINLQTTVNCFMDSSKDTSGLPPEKVSPGIRQILERKEGLFRKNMMGKRVDYACRSVISPDPYVGTNEIGLPKYFAEVLTYPTPVTNLNIDEMRDLVVRGPGEYPGARWVETNGRRIDLSRMKKQSRIAIGARLLADIKASGKPAIVGRQLRDGDYVLMNRQPTLHKPGIMAHKVRVLHSPTQKTIRMHYANCNTYNADFDGDEMNCHFPQSDLAQAEAYYIARTNLQYIVPTDGSPLRGLIQDHVVGGVKLTKRDTFLERWEYQQLVYSSLSSMPGLEIMGEDAVIELVPPAIIKPRPLWTGKQVVTTLLRHLQKGNDHDTERTSNFPGISMERKAKTPGTAFGDKAEEHLVVIRDGELLRGVLDKSAFGATDFSLVHSVYEAYGPDKAGLLLNALSRLFTAYIQFYAGHSCRTEDLILTKEADAERRNLVQRAYNLGTRAAKAWADSEGGKVQIPPVSESGSKEQLKPVEIAAASAKIGELLQGNEGKENFAALDGYMQGQLNPLASDIVKKSLPNGLVVPFPHNSFGIMTTTGAKGSIVNQSQVICSLGQQALEGRRVPRLSSGRTLPSFAPYDPRPRADGFVMDRFLTGVRPQEYYFHCMAGREGLVDTAVKTSRSGYLQRCLVKHLEELKICYDHTVRNAEGGVVQFLYGEDGLDPTKASYLDCTSSSLNFIARNHASVSRHNPSLPQSTLDISANDAKRYESVVGGNSDELLAVGASVKARKLRYGNEWKRGSLCVGWFDAIITKVRGGGKYVDLEYVGDRSRAKKVPIEVDLGARNDRQSNTTIQPAATVATLVKPCSFDPILCTPERGHLIGSSGAAISERVASHAAKEIETSTKLHQAMKSVNLSPEDLGKLVSAKYSASLCAPGEAVGSIAAQSIGEPSTQMTLNTFHLAGSGANVTLGIPRLREIIMTASQELKTPTMSVPLDDRVDERAALKLTRKYSKLTLHEVIAGHRGVTVTEKLEMDPSGDWGRVYHVKIKLHPAERINEAFGLSIHDIARVVAANFVPLLSRLMTLELRRSKLEGDASSTNVEGGEKEEYIEPQGDTRDSNLDADDLSEGDDEEDEADVGEEDGADAERMRSQTRDVSYEDESDSESDQNPAAQFLDTEAMEDDSPAPRETNSPKKKESQYPETTETSGLRVDRKSNTIMLSPLRTDPAARPLLMVGLVENAAKKTVVYSRQKIDQAFVNEEDGRGRCLQTAGVNFEELWNIDEVDHDRLLSNDIWAIRLAYGVEAARKNIVEQIRGVFGVYGIEVDPRHLSLIADYMTYEGGFKPMSRNGMKENSSAFLQMSFETTANFLKQACIMNDTETMMSPSANIVLGRPVRHGTGLLDVLAA